MMRHAMLAALALGTLHVNAPAFAQSGEREDPHLRNDCRLAAQVIRTGNPAPRREWAFDTIRRCDDSGPEVLADVWRTATPSEPQQLEKLWNVTRDFNDRRIVDAVADVARRSAAAETTRIYAFTLLFSYAYPGVYIAESDLLNPRGMPPGISGRTHDTRMQETRARLGDLRPEVGELLELVVAQEKQSRVGIAAAAVLRYLRTF